MNDRELLELIKRDRGAPLPEGPDPRWIAARVRMRVTQPESGLGPEPLLLLSLSLLSLFGLTAWALLSHRYAWLLLLPATLLIASPLLWKKGVTD